MTAYPFHRVYQVVFADAAREAVSPTGRPNIAPWLSVEDGTRAVEFYQAAFGARLLSQVGGDDGGIQVAQLSIGGAMFWVQQDIDAFPDEAIRPPSVWMILSVDDPDAALERAIAAGATLVAPVHEDFGWRTGRFTDPSGHDWEVSKQLGD